MDEDKKTTAPAEDPAPADGEAPAPYVPASPIKRAWAWVAVVYVVLCMVLFTYHLATARMLIGLGPLMLCPALGGLAATTVLRYRAGGDRSRLPMCVFLTGLCLVLLLFNLWTGIPSLLRNFGG